MKILIYILLLFTGSAYSQSVDSMIVVKTNGELIRYTTPAQYGTYISGDSLVSKGTTSKKRCLVSPLSLPISTLTQAALNLKASSSSVDYGTYRTILEASGSHIAAKVAGKYGMSISQPLAISGTGTLYTLQVIYIAAADYPSVNGLASKLRIRAELFTNDVAPTGNFTVGLYPITRPATSGGTGLNIYTLGTVVSGSDGAIFTTPAADGLNTAVGSDFTLPSDGFYVLGVVTTATVATSALVHINAQLQIHNQ